MKYNGGLALTLCLLFTTTTLAVPVSIKPDVIVTHKVLNPSQTPMECDGCKWFIGKSQEYLKTREPHLENITEGVLESGICSHLPTTEGAYCNSLIGKYVPFAFDSLVTKLLDPSFVCSEVIPLCSETALFKDDHFERNSQTTTACHSAVQSVSEYISQKSSYEKIAESIDTNCVHENPLERFACKAVANNVTVAVLDEILKLAFNGKMVCDDESSSYIFESTHSRKLLRFFSKIFRRSPPPPPPAPKPAPRPAPVQAPAPKAAPKPAPVPVPAPKAAPKPALVSAPKAAPKPAPVPVPAPKATPKPVPAPKAAPKPAPKATPKPAPKATPKPAPKATPKPAPKATPKPAPKATPKPAPKATPKPAPKATPKPVLTPKPITVPAPSSPKPNTVVIAGLAAAATVKPSQMSIYMTCDNEFDLYVNEKKIGRGTSWTTTYHLNPTVAMGDVVALDGVDRGGPAAFIGKFGNTVTKPSDWKCSTQSEPGWNKNNFDDSKWATAKSYGKNQESNIWRSVGGGSRPNIPGDAEWLWTSNNENHDRVYCRFFPFGKLAPAKPSATPAPAHTTVKTSVKPSAVPVLPMKPSATPAPTVATSVRSRPVPVKAKSTSSTTHHAVVTEINNGNAKSNIKLTKFQETIVHVMKDTSDQQIKLEAENKRNFQGASETLSLESTRLEKEKIQLKKIYDESVRLNATIQTHFKKIISDTAYLNSLDAMKPEFLKSLDNLWGHIGSVKNTVSVKLVGDNYKTEMIHLLDGIHANVRNISGYVATAFINHYNKYRALIQNENTQYSVEMARLITLSAEYKVSQQKVADIQKDRARIQDIVSDFNTAYDMSKAQRDDFDKLMKKIMELFDNKKCTE